MQPLARQYPGPTARDTDNSEPDDAAPKGCSKRRHLRHRPVVSGTLRDAVWVKLEPTHSISLVLGFIPRAQPVIIVVRSKLFVGRFEHLQDAIEGIVQV